jgi:hypothetical protein
VTVAIEQQGIYNCRLKGSASTQIFYD